MHTQDHSDRFKPLNTWQTIERYVSICLHNHISMYAIFHLYPCEPTLIRGTPDLQSIYIYLYIHTYIQISISVKLIKYLKPLRYLIPLIYRTRQNYIYIHIFIYPYILCIYSYIRTSKHLISISIDETYEILDQF